MLTTLSNFEVLWDNLFVLWIAVIGHVSDGSKVVQEGIVDGVISTSTLGSSSSSSPSPAESLYTSSLNNTNSGSNNVSLKQHQQHQQDLEEEAQKQLEFQRKGLPWIDKVASPNVTALLGKTAYLNCRVKNLADKTVS